MAAKTSTKANPVIAAALAPVQKPLAIWRQQRRHREPIPEGLWQMIVPLARVHGVSPVAQALGLNYTALKGRVVGRGDAPASAGQSPGEFVEVPVAPWPAGSQYILELEDRLGLKLTLRLAQGERTEVLAWAQGLWRQRS